LLASRIEMTRGWSEMDVQDRKAAIAAYKKIKSPAGIFAVRCEGSGQVWVGQTLNLDAVKNKIWFSLRVGSNRNPALQRAWSARCGDDFSFEPLERLEDEELAYVRDTRLKERCAHWRTRLNGLAI
jgi:hypothetical protein